MSVSEQVSGVTPANYRRRGSEGAEPAVSDLGFYLNVAVTGLSVGAVYALFGLGITLIYKATRVPNFAHAAIGTVGAYVFFKLWDVPRLQEPWINLRVPFTSLSWQPDPPALPFLAALLLALAAVGLLGLAIEKVVMRPLATAPTLNLIIATVALFGLLVGLAGDLFGQRFEAVPPIFPKGIRTIGDVNVSNDAIGILAVTAVLAVSLAVFFKRATLGVAIRATADSREVARLLGISADRVAGFSWAVGSMLAAIAGILVAPNAGLTSFGLSNLIVFGFTASLIGGFTSLVLTLVGGLAIGVITNLASAAPWPDGVVSDLLGGQGAPALITLLVVIGLLMARPGFIFKGIRLDEDSGVSFARTAEGINQEDAIRRRLDRSGQLGLLLKDWLVGRWVLGGGIALVLIVVPILKTSYYSTVLTFGIIGSITALSVVVLTGWTGQISVAPLTFVGIGAYATAIATSSWGLPAPLAILFAGLATVPFAVLLGVPALRLRGFFFALATMAFAFAGPGWLFIQPAVIERSQVDRGLFGNEYVQPIYFAALGTAVLLFLAMRNLRDSRVGRTFFALRDSHSTAQVMGIDPVRYKLLAFATSGFIAGIAGAFTGFLNQNVQGSGFLLFFSLAAVLQAVVSGVGLLFGAVLTGFLFSVLPQLTATPTSGVDQAPVIIGGWLAIITIIQNPNGIASMLLRLVRPFDPSERVAWASAESDEAVVAEEDEGLFERAAEHDQDDPRALVGVPGAR
jgi:branched-subunit amino acid ABC-type transport system permease component